MRRIDAGPVGLLPPSLTGAKRARVGSLQESAPRALQLQFPPPSCSERPSSPRLVAVVEETKEEEYRFHRGRDGGGGGGTRGPSGLDRRAGFGAPVYMRPQKVVLSHRHLRIGCACCVFVGRASALEGSRAETHRPSRFGRDRANISILDR